MKKNNYYVYVIVFIGIFLVLFPNKTLAKEQSNLGYTVTAVPSSKQIDFEQTYFYLQTTPGEVQQLKVKIKSTQKEAVKINIYVADAFTGNRGTLEYTDDEKLLDSSLKQPMSSIAKIETPSITVENFEEKEAIIQLTPPAESYSGVKMGVLVFELDSSDSKEKVKNKFSYRLGLVTSENGDDYRDSKTLTLLGAKSTLKQGRKMILATLQNIEPKVLSNLEIQAEVKEKESKKVVKKETVTNYTMAPNSHFDFEMEWGTRTTVKAGTYLLSMTAHNDYNDWTFEKEFTITDTEAKKMNEETAFKIITPTWIKVVTILLFILTGVIVVWLMVRRKKMEAQWKSKKKKRKKRKKKEGK